MASATGETEEGSAGLPYYPVLETVPLSVREELAEKCHKPGETTVVRRVIFYLIVLAIAQVVGLLASRVEAGKDVTDESGKKMVDGEEYKLSWSDEFNGAKLDKEKWRHRSSPGYRSTGSLATTDGSYVDGDGHLALTMCALTKAELASRVTTKKEKEAVAELPDDAWTPAMSHLITQRTFRYGYHEVRFKLPLVPGPGFCFWFIIHQGQATEIDVLEQTLYHGGALVDYKSSTLHWYPDGYQPENRQSVSYQFARPQGDENAVARTDATSAAGQVDPSYKPDPPHLTDKSTQRLIRKTYSVKDTFFHWDDEQFHTVALLWTPTKYSFYYDGYKVCTYEVGLSDAPEPAILDLRCMDSLETLGQSQDRSDPRKTPARVLVDYYRVYEAVKK